MAVVQLDFFLTPEESEIEALRKEVIAVRASNDRVRKKLFGENGRLIARVTELETRLAILERNICKGDLWKV